MFKSHNANHMFKKGTSFLNRAAGVFNKTAPIISRASSTIGKVSNVLAQNPDISGSQFGKQTIQGLDQASKFGGVLSNVASQTGSLLSERNPTNALEKAKQLKTTSENLMNFV